MEKSIVIEFLHKLKRNNKLTLLEKYVDLLMQENTKVNLISRKVQHSDLWTNHIYDSIIPCKYYNFSNKTILDFGTGGGLPGIPIKIIYPTVKLYLLDSIGKKINAVNKICKELKLTNCFFINSRLEETSFSIKFDYILSRSVKMNKNYINRLLEILKPKGRIILYKGENPEQIIFEYPYKIIKPENSHFKNRKLVEIYKNG